MKKTIGILCLVGGMLLGFGAYNHSESVEGQMNRIFSSTEKNRATWMYIGAAALVTTGIFTIYVARK